MRLREAILADKRGFAEARDEAGRLIAVASGASWRQRPHNQRRRGHGLSVKFFFPIDRVLRSGLHYVGQNARSVAWSAMARKDRRKVNSWEWQPMTPRSAVDLLGDVARGGSA